MGAGTDVGIGGERVQGGGVGVKWWEGGKARRGRGACNIGKWGQTERRWCGCEGPLGGDTRVTGGVWRSGKGVIKGGRGGWQGHSPVF